MHFEVLIKPALLRLLSEEEGGYRVERELHHHLTVCLEHVLHLRLGRWDRVVKYEEPTTGKYSWSGSGAKSGNVDFFFPTVGSGSNNSGAAMELNLNYDSWTKIRRDFIKLIDHRNAYREMVYFAYGFKLHFQDAVVKGLEKAFQSFREDDSGFLLPAGLHILVVESQRGRGERVLWETQIAEPCVPGQLSWDQTAMPYLAPKSREARQLGEEGETELIEGIPGLYISREEAEAYLRKEIEKAGIPLHSTTARCMFEPTKDSRGGNNCKLGRTPLWDNHLRMMNGRVHRPEFRDWVERLVESGHKFQKAGRASLG